MPLPAILQPESVMIHKQNAETRRLGTSFAASLAAHMLLVLLIGVMHSSQKPAHKKAPQTMDVVMLDQKAKPKRTPPKDAKTMSDRNAEGGDKAARDKVTRQARAPKQAPKQPGKRPQPPAMPKQAPAPKRDERTRLLTQKGPTPTSQKKPKPVKPPTPKKRHRPPAPNIPLNQLMPSTTDLAQLSHRYERERRMRQLNAKEADIPINTREAKYAPYAQFLVRALEEQWRPGQADYNRYTQDARQATIRLTIEKNGDLGGIEILRPSPIPEINESAIRAINAASPFRPLPRSWGLDRVSFYLTFEVVNDKFVFRTM